MPLAALLGPAFVAAIAYLDPGNVAANLSAGASYGYALVWVIVLANAMAVLVQYLSAKLGLVTGRTLASLVSERLHPRGRGLALAYGVQAVGMTMATDLAEVVGGALGLWLLTGMPLWLGGVVVAVVTMVALRVLARRPQRRLEIIVASMSALVGVCFVAGLVWAPPDPAATVRGLVPWLPDSGAIALAVAMLGATVMPHAIYVHSALAADRFHGVARSALPRLVRVQQLDVGLALAGAGTVNLVILVYGASALTGGASDEIAATAAELTLRFGPVAGLALGLGLLASGLASSLVGTHAGSRIALDTLPFTLSATIRRAITVAPAVALLAVGISPTRILVVSQIILSFGIPFALVGLIILTGSRAVMGDHVDGRLTQVLAWATTAAIIVLNVALLVVLV